MRKLAQQQHQEPRKEQSRLVMLGEKIGERKGAGGLLFKHAGKVRFPLVPQRHVHAVLDDQWGEDRRRGQHQGCRQHAPDGSVARGGRINHGAEVPGLLSGP